MRRSSGAGHPTLLLDQPQVQDTSPWLPRPHAERFRVRGTGLEEVIVDQESIEAMNLIEQGEYDLDPDRDLVKNR